MMKKKILLALIVLMTSSFSVYGFQGESSKVVLESGLTIIVSEMPSSPMVSVYALVKAGSATEGKYLGSGVSHFLEHLLFKGTEKRKVGEIAAQIQAVGGSINASTSLDYTIFTLTVPHEAFDIALDILSDMIMRATLDKEEIEKERTVVIGEMRLHNDNPDHRISELVFQSLYLRHPYKYPVIGYKTLFNQLTYEDIRDYYHSQYVPSNTIVSVVGRVDTDDVLPKIKEAFKDYRQKVLPIRNLPVEPPQISARFYEETYPTKLTRLTMSFGTVGLLDRGLFALDVLARILGEGASSRLYLDLYKQKNLVHSVSAFHFTPVDRGFFGIEVLLDENNTEAAARAIFDNIALIQKEGIDSDELNKVKKQILSEHILSEQRSSHLAYSQAIDEAYTGDYRFSEKYVQAIREMTAGDIQEAAKHYLLPSNLTQVILRPDQSRAAARPEKAKNQVGEIKKVILNNGLTVLIREDHTFPSVAMRLVLNGGTRQETEELNGISSMTARAWPRGTKSKTANQIAKEMESLGISYDSHSGKNSFGINFEFLTEDTVSAFNALEDFVKNPIFPEDEILKIKEDMKTQIRQREDNIGKFTGHALRKILFLVHPFRFEEEGTLESVTRINRDDVVNFYNTYVAPSNMVLSVFGDIDPEKTMDEIVRRFGQLKSKEVNLKSIQENPPDQPRMVDLTMDKEQAMVAIGFQGVSLSDPDYYGLEVMTSILGSSFSGRLFNTVREELGQAYTLGGDAVSGLDTGFIYFYVLTNTENVQKAKEKVLEEIQKLQTEYVSDKELQDIKNYLKGNFTASQETNSALSFMTSLDELYNLGYDHFKAFDKKIDGVTKLDVRRLASRYLDTNKMAVVVTTSQSKVNNQPHSQRR